MKNFNFRIPYKIDHNGLFDVQEYIHQDPVISAHELLNSVIMLRWLKETYHDDPILKKYERYLMVALIAAKNAASNEMVSTEHTNAPKLSRGYVLQVIDTLICILKNGGCSKEQAELCLRVYGTSCSFIHATLLHLADSPEAKHTYFDIPFLRMDKLGISCTTIEEPTVRCWKINTQCSPFNLSSLCKPTVTTTSDDLLYRIMGWVMGISHLASSDSKAGSFRLVGEMIKTHRMQQANSSDRVALVVNLNETRLKSAWSQVRNILGTYNVPVGELTNILDKFMERPQRFGKSMEACEAFDLNAAPKIPDFELEEVEEDAEEDAPSKEKKVTEEPPAEPLEPIKVTRKECVIRLGKGLPENQLSDHYYLRVAVKSLTHVLETKQDLTSSERTFITSFLNKWILQVDRESIESVVAKFCKIIKM